MQQRIPSAPRSAIGAVLLLAAAAHLLTHGWLRLEAAMDRIDQPLETHHD